VSTTALTEHAEAAESWPAGHWQVSGPAYALVLRDAPDHLVPVSARERLRRDLERTACLSSGCTLEGSAGTPPWLSPPPQVHHDPWTAWVRHPGHGAMLPYLLDRDAVLAVEAAAAGRLGKHALGELQRWQLMAAGILTLAGSERDEQVRWSEGVARARDEYAQRGFTTMPSVLEPLHVGGLRRYYRTLVRHAGTNGVHLGDKQTAGRFVAYNEPVARFFQHQLTDAVSQVVGQAVKPSFCFSACYVQGPGLPLHVDRLQCQYTLSLLVDMWPEPFTTASWPLVLTPGPNRIAIRQALGDGVLFKGREIPHGRPPMRKKWFSTSLLFHYVDLDFEGPLG
jgi:hypothetical protein